MGETVGSILLLSTLSVYKLEKLRPPLNPNAGVVAFKSCACDAVKAKQLSEKAAKINCVVFVIFVIFNI
jgi:hypothetical protein